MKTQSASIGGVIVDSLPFSQGGTAAQARSLKDAGVSGVALYLGVASARLVADVLGAGLAIVPVTLAGEYNDGPNDEVGQLKAWGIPAGATVFLDLEGLSAFKSDPVDLAAKINAWANGLIAAGYMPGLYVGVPQPFTSAELWALKVQRYWRGQGSIRDRFNNLAEPTGGWCMTQCFPSHSLGGVWVDSNMCGQDFKLRTINWVTS